MQFDVYEEVVGEVGALRALREAGSKTVLIYEDRRLAADECVRTIYQMARAMKAAGLESGFAMGMLSLNRPETYLAQLAGQLVGARYTPLHPMASLDDHDFVLQDAEIDCLVYDSRLYSKRVEELRARGSVKQTFALGTDGDQPDLLAEASKQSADPIDPAPLRGGDIGTVYYTGGTTGKPKGVMTTRFSKWYTEITGVGTPEPSEYMREPRLLINTPISHAGGTMIGPMLMRGGSVVLVDKFEPAEFLKTIEREQVTNIFLVPTMIYVLLDHLRDHDSIDVSSLDQIVYGAAPMSPARLKEALERFGQIFVQGYGQTEAGVGILRLAKEDHRLDRPDLLASAGRPTLGVVAKILRDDDTEANIGEVGELCLRGPMLMQGYWKNPELTASALRGGWLHTDDMGFQDAEGYITLVDRKKDMIISGGFNVYPREVEDALSEHAAVSASAVVGVPDEKWGEAVKAFVVLKAGMQATEDELINHVRKLKGPVNTPKSVVLLGALPVTQIGKLDKKALRRGEWNN